MCIRDSRERAPTIRGRGSAQRHRRYAKSRLPSAGGKSQRPRGFEHTSIANSTTSAAFMELHSNAACLCGLSLISETRGAHWLRNATRMQARVAMRPHYGIGWAMRRGGLAGDAFPMPRQCPTCLNASTLPWALPWWRLPNLLKTAGKKSPVRAIWRAGNPSPWSPR